MLAISSYIMSISLNLHAIVILFKVILCKKEMYVGKWLNSNALWFRIWDDDFNADDINDIDTQIVTAYEITKEGADMEPRIGISDGSKGFLGPLPGSVDELLVLFEEYRG